MSCSMLCNIYILYFARIFQIYSSGYLTDRCVKQNILIVIPRHQKLMHSKKKKNCALENSSRRSQRSVILVFLVTFRIFSFVSDDERFCLIIVKKWKESVKLMRKRIANNGVRWMLFTSEKRLFFIVNGALSGAFRNVTAETIFPN